MRQRDVPLQRRRVDPGINKEVGELDSIVNGEGRAVVRRGGERSKFHNAIEEDKEVESKNRFNGGRDEYPQEEAKEKKKLL